MSSLLETQKRIIDDIKSELLFRFTDTVCGRRISLDLKRICADEIVTKSRIYWLNNHSLTNNKLIIKNKKTNILYSINIPIKYPFEAPTIQILTPLDSLYNEIDKETQVLCKNNTNWGRDVSPAQNLFQWIIQADLIIDKIIISNKAIPGYKLIHLPLNLIKTLPISDDELDECRWEYEQDKLIVFGYTRLRFRENAVAVAIKYMLTAFYSKYGRYSRRI